MKTVKKNWAKLAAMCGFGLSAIIVVWLCATAWGQSLPGLSITMTNTNTAVFLTVTNGVNTSQYQIYTKETLEDEDWVLISNGITGQTNFLVNLSDADSAFYRAQINSGSGTPLSISITSPANGANVQ